MRNNDFEILHDLVWNAETTLIMDIRLTDFRFSRFERLVPLHRTVQYVCVTTKAWQTAIVQCSFSLFDIISSKYVLNTNVILKSIITGFYIFPFN
jgi:hypothetical protein